MGTYYKSWELIANSESLGGISPVRVWRESGESGKHLLAHLLLRNVKNRFNFKWNSFC